MKMIRSHVAYIVANRILEHRTPKKRGPITIHTYHIERNLIPLGPGSISASRYLRFMREMGMIRYNDPRANGHIYKIYPTKKLYELIKKYEKRMKERRKTYNGQK